MLTQEQVDAANAALAVLVKIYQAPLEDVTAAFSATSEAEFLKALGLTQQEWDAVSGDQLDSITKAVEGLCGTGTGSAQPSAS